MLGYINEKLVYGSICSKLPAEHTGMWKCYLIFCSENMCSSGAEIERPQSSWMQLRIHTNDKLAANNDYMIMCIEHQQNVNRSGRHIQTFQTLRSTSPELLSSCRCSQAPLELSKVLADSARAFSGAPESTWRYGGGFWMVWYLTSRIVKFRSSWDICAALPDT